MLLTKEQTFGYIIMAARDLDFDKNDIEKLIIKTKKNIIDWTEEMAEQTYDDFKEGK